MKIKLSISAVLDINPEDYNLPADARRETIIAALQCGVVNKEWNPIDRLTLAENLAISFEGVES